MDDKGVVTFLAADGNVVKRYRISAASDTSVASLVANGTTVAVAPAPAAPPVVAATPPPAQPGPTPTPTPVAAVKPAPVATPPTSSSAPAVLLTWNDLVRRPEARPTTCTVNKDYRFQGGAVVSAGSTVNVIEIRPGDLVL
jgi:hypothetical protein